MANEILSECPVCNGNTFLPFIMCTDFTATHEKFGIQRCATCSMLFTNPRPDNSSIEKYYDSDQYISHTGKSTAFFDSIYLLVRRLTIRWKINLIKRRKVPVSVLDYGCGTGDFLKACQLHGWQASGVEPSKVANKKAQGITGITIYTDIQEVSDKKFDVITLWHVLEHIPDLTRKLSELKSLLNENGMLFIAVPNHTSYDAMLYREYWAGYDVPRHLWHFSKTTMEQLLKNVGLHLKQVLPMKLDAYYVSLLSEKYKSGSTSPEVFLWGIINGYRSNRRGRAALNHSSLIYIATP